MKRRMFPLHRTMKTRKVVIVTGLLLMPCLILLCCGCTDTGASPQPGPVNSSPVSTVGKVEVYHFHAARQCSTCITLGAYAEETVNTSFAPEVASGKLVFAHVNIELPENQALVEQYGPTGSSLWIGVYDQDGFHKEENLNVWYKVGDRNDYESYLKGVIGRRLAGDFS